MLQYTYQKSDTRAQSSPNLRTRPIVVNHYKISVRARAVNHTRRRDSNPRACQMLPIYGFFRLQTRRAPKLESELGSHDAHPVLCLNQGARPHPNLNSGHTTQTQCCVTVKHKRPALRQGWLEALASGSILSAYKVAYPKVAYPSIWCLFCLKLLQDSRGVTVAYSVSLTFILFAVLQCAFQIRF